MNKKVLTVFGTRPEVIKLASTIWELKKKKIENVLVNTGQHKEMTDLALKEFKITPNYRLKVMKQNQSLNFIMTNILTKLDPIIEKEKPNLVVVLGDTASSMAGALSAYHHQVPILHIEAGVRTHNKYNAFPEEGYRRMIDQLIDYATCQHEKDMLNLVYEPHNIETILVGNTSLDLIRKYKGVEFKKKILITMHRREDWGKPIENACKSIKRLSNRFKDHQFVFVLHPNPILKKSIRKILGKQENVYLVENLPFYEFIRHLSESKLIMTDSGGLLQEALFLRKPIVYLRKDSEYKEIFDNRTVIETGKKTKLIEKHVTFILKENDLKSNARNKFGNGCAGNVIAGYIKVWLK